MASLLLCRAGLRSFDMVRTPVMSNLHVLVALLRDEMRATFLLYSQKVDTKKSECRPFFDTCF